jgi:hypothetical protein
LRALFLRESIAGAMGDKGADGRAGQIWERLTGRYKPDLDHETNRLDERIKKTMTLLF